MSKSERLETREGRKKLAMRHEPYWRSVGRGVAIGYRKAEQGAAWYVRRHHGSGYHKRVLGETDDAFPADGQLRLSWADALRIALDEPKRESALKLHYTVHEAVDGYFVHRAARGRSDESLGNDRSKVRTFLERFGDRYLADLTTSELQSWRDGLVAAAVAEAPESDDAKRRDTKRRAQATVNRAWAIIRAALNWAFTTGRVDSDLAWRRVKPFQNVDRPRTRFLSTREAQRFLKKCPGDFRPIAHAALLTGLRLGELTNLRAGDVGAKAVEVAPGKTGRSRRVPLTQEGADAFRDWVRGLNATDLVFRDEAGQPWTRPTIGRRIAEASSAASLSPPVTFHDLRRTYGSLLANAGARDSIIAAALGHADTRMTRRHYGHLLDTAIAKELQARLPRFAARTTRGSKRGGG